VSGGVYVSIVLLWIHYSWSVQGLRAGLIASLWVALATSLYPLSVASTSYISWASSVLMFNTVIPVGIDIAPSRLPIVDRYTTGMLTYLEHLHSLPALMSTFVSTLSFYQKNVGFEGCICISLARSEE
jgi:energy-converting hydrogenase Eha subunit A